jgi:hypothetical protein
MDTDTFWGVIEECRKATDSCEGLADLVVQRLSRLPAPEIAGFARVMDEMLDRAYRWDLWGAAYIINGGCSDDGFEYFRCWLISQGREVYERALRNPEDLAELAEPEVECEDLLYAPLRAYEAVTGKNELPERYAPHPAEPAGTRWTEDDLDERFPRLTGAFG